MDESRKRLVYGLIIVAVLLAVFLAGWIPASQRTSRAAAEADRCEQRIAELQGTLAQTQHDLEVARLRGQLGEVLQQANANNFGVAAERATAFFDGLRGATANATNPQRRQVLEATLARRDEIAGDLARADGAVRAKLAQLYMEFGNAQ